MSEKLILAFDVGTQSMRAVLVTPQGDILDAEQKIYDKPYVSPKPDWAEQDPDFYYDALCEVSRSLLARNGKHWERIAAVALTAFRDTVVCLDGARKPLRPAIVWLDQRRAKKLKPIPLKKRLLFALVGMGETIDMLYHTSVCNWLAENEPDMWAKMDKYVLLSTYLNYKLTGELADAVASQIAMFPFDYKNRSWDKNGITRCLYNIPQDKLCERIVPSGERLGCITESVSAETLIPAGLPLIATGSDKGCETLGLSVVKEGRAALSFGTTATVQFASKKYYEPTPLMPAYPAVPNDLFNGEIQLFRGYWMLTWFKQNFAEAECAEAKRLGCAAEELLNKHLKDVPAGSDGLLLLPYWTPGLARPDARGAMIGFSDVHTKYHIYRAIIEGINFGLMEGLAAMEKSSGQKITELYVGGGGSRSDEILQITADMFGLPVRRIQTNEASCLGAAMCAFVSLGEFADYAGAIDSMVHIQDVFEPDKRQHALYERIYHDVYKKYYKTLRPLHKRLRALTGREQA